MHWDTVTVLTLISGIAMLIGGVLPDMTGTDKLWSLGLGAAFVVYAFIGANMTSGVFLYNPLMFAVPVLTLVRVGYVLAGGHKKNAGEAASEPISNTPASQQSRPGNPASPPPVNVPVSATRPHPTLVRFERGRCTACGKPVPADLHEFHRNGCAGRAAQPAPAGPAATPNATPNTASSTAWSNGPSAGRTRPHPASIRFERGRCSGCGKPIEPDVREFHRNACGGRPGQRAGA